MHLVTRFVPFYFLQILNYEFYHSVKIIEDYLKNGGSLIECLEILPSIIYSSIKEQMSNILGFMENHLPKYLMPATSLLKRSFSEGVLDTDEIYRPNWGPLKSDLLEKIPLKELREAAVPLSYRETIKDLKGPWPKVIGETASLINNKVIPLRRELIAYVLANLKIPDATAEVRKSVVHLVEYLQQDSEREFSDFKTSFDPYKLVANAISSLPLRNETLIAANLLLSFLKKPPECRSVFELNNFFHNNVLNYTLLISRDRIISKTRAGLALMSMIEQNNEEIQNTIRQFSSFEYIAWKDLLLAFVSQLRRDQNHRDKVSDIVDNVYGDIVLKDVRKRWRLLRNQVIARTLFSAIGRRESSARIQRLLADVGLDKSIQPKNWRKALVFASDDDINGPIDAVLKTFKALLASEILSSDILKANIAELVDKYDNRFDKECSSRLESYRINFSDPRTNIDKKIKITDIDVEDLLQALRDLDVYTDEYKNLQSFLSRNDLETKIGQLDINAHPTRGRLLSQLLQMLGHATDVDNSLRYLAWQFVDNVAYEGYGAGVPLLYSN